MNWNYWLPWRDYPSLDDEDFCYESRVIEQCDHEFEETTERIGANLDQAWVEDGLLLVPVMEKVQQFCRDCGEPGLNGEPFPYDSYEYEFVAPYDGEWVRMSHKLVFEADFIADRDVTVSEALVTEEDPDEEPGRIIVNSSDDNQFDVAD